MTDRSRAGIRHLWPAHRSIAAVERTPPSVQRDLDRLRALGPTRRLWFLGPDFRLKTVALRRPG